MKVEKGMCTRCVCLHKVPWTILCIHMHVYMVLCVNTHTLYTWNRIL